MGYWQGPHLCAYSCPLIINLLKIINKGKWLFTTINNQQNLCESSIYYESIFATKGVVHYLDYPRYVGIFEHFCMIIFNIWKI